MEDIEKDTIINRLFGNLLVEISRLSDSITFKDNDIHHKALEVAKIALSIASETRNTKGLFHDSAK